MRRREFITAVASAAVAGTVAARARQGTTKRIGVLMPELRRQRGLRGASCRV